MNSAETFHQSLSHWLVRLIAATNIIYTAGELAWGSHHWWPSSASSQPLMWWLLMSSVALPLYVLIEWIRFGKAGSAKSKRAILVDGAFALAWCLFLVLSLVWAWVVLVGLGLI